MKIFFAALVLAIAGTSAQAAPTIDYSHIVEVIRRYGDDSTKVSETLKGRMISVAVKRKLTDGQSPQLTTFIFFASVVIDRSKEAF
ncbi:hypothetical protein GN316_19390 [Xylophilus sp. Kf1]|nr:hypothetical protein [Xylophilus sp. Kf1]